MENQVSGIRVYRAKLTCDVELADGSLPTAAGTVRIQYWLKRDRLKRALKASGQCLFLAVVAVFMPFAHFFLVPFFLIATVAVGVYLYGQQSLVVGGAGKCPVCAADFVVAKSRNRFPLSDLCTSCQRTVRVYLEDRIEEP
jgi:hypothetical protein